MPSMGHPMLTGSYRNSVVLFLLHSITTDPCQQHSLQPLGCQELLVGSSPSSCPGILHSQGCHPACCRCWRGWVLGSCLQVLPSRPGLSHHVHKAALPMEKPGASSVMPVLATLPCSGHRGAEERAGHSNTKHQGFAPAALQHSGIWPLGLHVAGGHSQPCPGIPAGWRIAGITTSNPRHKLPRDARGAKASPPCASSSPVAH